MKILNEINANSRHFNLRTEIYGSTCNINVDDKVLLKLAVPNKLK